MVYQVCLTRSVLSCILRRFPQDAAGGETETALQRSDTELARESSRQLSKLVAEVHDAGKLLSNVQLHIQATDAPEERVAIPESVLKLLAYILAQIASGNTVTLMPIQAEVSTQQAADFLNVSRPFLVNLLDSGQRYSRLGVGG